MNVRSRDSAPPFIAFLGFLGKSAIDLVGSPVEIFGIQAGSVQKIEIDPDKGMAIVQMGIKKGIKVYEDAIASIKTAGLIGDKFIKVDPGGSEVYSNPEGLLQRLYLRLILRT